MEDTLTKSDEFSRRRFVTQAAKTFLGASILPWAMPRETTAAGLGLNRPLNHAGTGTARPRRSQPAIGLAAGPTRRLPREWKARA